MRDARWEEKGTEAHEIEMPGTRGGRPSRSEGSSKKLLYYQLLDVSPDATEDEIKRQACRRLFAWCNGDAHMMVAPHVTRFQVIRQSWPYVRSSGSWLCAITLIKRWKMRGTRRRSASRRCVCGVAPSLAHLRERATSS